MKGRLVISGFNYRGWKCEIEGEGRVGARRGKFEE